MFTDETRDTEVNLVLKLQDIGEGHLGTHEPLIAQLHYRNRNR